MNDTSKRRFYIGVYGILINKNQILLIKKSRGAYKGSYDLPGGGIEFKEEIEEALKREFLEEAGVVLKGVSFVVHNEYFCDYFNESGKNRSLHHIAFYYKVSGNINKIKKCPDGQDSLGAEFIDISNLDKIKIAPMAKLAIKRVISQNLKTL